MLQISCFATMKNNLLSFSKLILFLVWAEENKLDAILVVIMYHNVKKIDGKQCLRLILILFDHVPFICIFARWMVILQDSCKTKGYLARSCKILEENLARRCIVLQDFARIMQDLARWPFVVDWGWHVLSNCGDHNALGAQTEKTQKLYLKSNTKRSLQVICL